MWEEAMKTVLGSPSRLGAGIGCALIWLVLATPWTPTARVWATVPATTLGELAYIQDGDIWVRGLPDGEPRRITEDGANSSPHWSPSGHWLAFRKGDQAWLTGDRPGKWWQIGEGTAVRSFAWSPTDDRLAYVTDAGELRLINVTASSGADPTAQPSSVPAPGPLNRLAWSPDGQWLAFDVTQETQPGAPPQRMASLWRVRADGSGAEEVYATQNPAQDGLVVAGWSPDGESILFWPDPQFSASVLADGVPLNSIAATGGQPREVAPAMLLHQAYLAPAPKGNLLAVVGGAGRETWTDKHIVIVDLNHHTQRAVTGPKLAAADPAFSPDATRLAYVLAPDAGPVGGGEAAKISAAQRHIWIAAVDGSNPRQLTNETDFRDERPLWSADGRHILFARIDPEGRATIWLMPADGGPARPMVDELTPGSDWFGYYGYVEWANLFDWWRGAPDQRALARAEAVASWPTYSDATYHVSLQYPDRWQSREDFGGVRYEGSDGFFGFSAAGGEGATLDAVADLEAHQTARPYGSQPEITPTEVQGQPARLIMPSGDQATDMRGQAALIVAYPQPMTIQGGRYLFLVLHADQSHIQDLSATLRWLAP
jgi:Tol biopolymer transport system component